MSPATNTGTNTGRPQDPPSTTGARPDERAHPLSFAQEQLWFLDQLAPGKTVYNILMVWRLKGPLRPDLLQRCLDLVVARHDALRVTMRQVEDAPYQVVAPAADVPLPVTDLSALPAAEREQRLRAEIGALRAEPYDLETGPLYRFRLFRLAAGDTGEAGSTEEYVFCQGFHHIIMDGWSTALLNAELSSAYQSLHAGTEPVFEDAELDYTGFAAAQRERLHGDGMAEELDFWRRKLAGVPVLELADDRPRPADGGHRGETLVKDFPDDLRGIVQQLAADHGASPFMVLAAAYNLVLSRYTGLDDIPIGVPMLGRPEPELEAVVGMFVNMAVLRCDLSGDPTFSELIDRVADGSMELYEHQEAPFNQVVDAVQPARVPDRNPLFQVSMQLLGEANSGTNLGFTGVAAEPVPLAGIGSRFDISTTVIDSGSALRVDVEYSSDLFDAWRMEAMLAHVETVLRAAAADPGLPLSRIPVTTGAEAEQLLAAGRGEPAGDAPQPVPVPAAVAELAGKRPDAIAVVCDGFELTYGELDRRAGLLADRLRAAGLRDGQVAAVVLDRDIDACVALLAVLKAGGAYTVLDSADATGHLAFVMGDTAAKLVVTSADLAERLPEPSGWQIVLLDSDTDFDTDPDTGPDRDLRTDGSVTTAAAGPSEEPAEGGAPACVLYTADATGRLRGVLIPHRTLSFGCEGYRRLFDFAADDRLLLLPPLSSGLAQTELWTALTCGATVVAVPPAAGAAADRLTALMRDQRVTYAHLPPVLRSRIDAGACPDLRYVAGGDRVPPPDPDSAWGADGRRHVNLYGPPEAPVSCTEHEPAATARHLPFPTGRPHVNRQVYVVDRSMNLVPRGVVGELLISGAPGSLAAGYLNQPELTATRFVDDPFHPGRPAFLSGEQARWTADLRLELLGRADDRIGLRGLPIEPAEIEAALAGHPDVRDAVVLVRPDDNGDDRLVGCVTPAADRQPVPEELRGHLAARLPAHMVPTAWAVLAEFPLRAGWRIDRAALQDLAGAASGEEDHDEPRTPTERSVAGIFGEVLSLPEVGAEESFFDVGGNSLQAMRAVSRINKRFGIKLSIRALYGNVTVRAVAAVVDEKAGETPA